MDHSNATTGRFLTAHRAVRGVLACVALVALAVLFHSVRAHEGSSVQRATFLDRALGSPSADASLERRTVSGSALAVGSEGLTAHVGAATVSLRARGASGGDWQRHASGVTRATSFGSESILFGINRAEQFLTVARRQGTRTWSWQLDATHGTPHIDPTGAISFARAGRLAGFHILPVAILDRSGRDITPAACAGRSSGHALAGHWACGSTTGRCRSHT